MKWFCGISGGKRFSLFLVLFLLFSLVGSPLLLAQQEPQYAISVQKYNELVKNMTTLSQLNERQKQQLVDLKASSAKQAEELVSLRIDIDLLQKQIDDSLIELNNLKELLNQSQQDSTNLQTQLQKAEDSYKSLYESFLDYQKKVDKIIKDLKAQIVGLKVLAGAGWTVAGGLTVYILVKAFGK